jgi:hypothetical protein
MQGPDELELDVTPVPDPNGDREWQTREPSEGEDSAGTSQASPSASPIIDTARSMLQFADQTLRRQLEERPYVVLAGAAGAGVLVGGGPRLVGVALRAGRKMVFNIALGQALDFFLPKPPKHG